VFATQFLDTVLKDAAPHRCGPVVRIEALAVGGPSLALVDEPDVYQLVEVVVEVMGLDIVYYLVDLYWIGHLGADAIAVMSYSRPVIFFVISLGPRLTTAVTVLVAQNEGAGVLVRRTPSRKAPFRSSRWSQSCLR
jgi:hypothetical protein